MSDQCDVQLNFGDELGQGSYGIVYRGTLSGRQVAIKKIVSHYCNGNFIKHEINHPNVLQLLHVEDISSAKYFVMELCEATLDDYCGGKYHGPVPSEMNGLIQMASGLSYLHSKQIIHRDLKATNILIGCNMFKLSDFGLVAPSVEDGEYSRPPGARVDNYKAAELWRFRRLEMDAISRQQMELSADVFAMGCIFYFYLTRGSNPFGQEPIIAVNIINGESDLTGLSSEHFAFDLIKSMIHACAELRPSSKDITQRLIAMPSVVRKHSYGEEINGHVTCCAFHPLADVLACGMSQGKICLLNRNSVKVLRCSTEADVVQIGWNVPGNLLAAGCADGTVVTFHETGAKKFEMKIHSHKVHRLKWNCKGAADLLATCDENGVVLWNVEALPSVEKFPHSSVRDVIWMTAEKFCFCSDDGTVQVAQKGRQNPLKIIYEKANQLGLHDNGQLITCGEGSLRVWSMDGIGNKLLKSANSKFQCFDCHRKSSEIYLIACGNGDPSITVWNLENNNYKPVTLAGLCTGFTTFSFSSNGKYLAAADAEGFLYIWSTTDWNLLHVQATSNRHLDFCWDTFSTKIALTEDKVTVLELSAIV